MEIAQKNLKEKIEAYLSAWKEPALSTSKYDRNSNLFVVFDKKAGYDGDIKAI